MRENKAQAWGLIAPTLTLMILIGVIPVLYIIYLSAFKYNVFSRVGMVYTGFNNFRKLMFDQDFLKSLRLGLTFVVLCCAIEMPLGLLIANLLTFEFKGKGIFRTIMTLPLAMAPISIGSMWVLLTNPDIGPIPFYLRKMGVDYNIGVNATQAFFTTVFVDVWHWTPFVTLTLMAGLSSLPKQPYEAALVDGANRWQTFRYVTLPLLKPILLTTLFIRIMDTFRIFDEVWMLTSGGPGTATRYVSIHLVRLVLQSMEYGYSSAMSLFLLYLTIVMCWLLLTFISSSQEAS
ncbi:MAG: multiple sugar transport system permease protein [Candidatus Atribacteria bacterium]|uniref:carbohydrate ABC transporter permease n=1 Tax=Atrimonas thermophila TaxID=3064161 RepID=UPI0024ABF9DB|nr:multiple sugar transport system permease protein [Candidatus Atribacteria bacterium]